MAKAKKVGILTAGGDSPALNATIRGFGKTAMGQYGIELIGFRDGVTGLVCGGTDAQSVEQAIRRFVALSPEERARMGQRGYELARERFAVRHMVARTVEVYARVLGDPGLAAP